MISVKTVTDPAAAAGSFPAWKAANSQLGNRGPMCASCREWFKCVLVKTASIY